MAEQNLNDEAYEFVKANAVNDGYNAKHNSGKWHVPADKYATFRKDHGITPEVDQAQWELNKAMINAIDKFNGEKLVEQIETAIKENRDGKLEKVETVVNGFKRSTLSGVTTAYRKHKNPRTGEPIDSFGSFHPDCSFSSVHDKDMREKIEDNIKKALKM